MRHLPMPQKIFGWRKGYLDAEKIIHWQDR
jgi:hypothetical protein